MFYDMVNVYVRDLDLCILIYWLEKIMKEMYVYIL